MTPKQKARAYDKLLIKAKQIYNKENDVLIIHTLEDLFPELKESEDEKTRKRIIALVNAHGQGMYKDDMLTWLENTPYTIDHEKREGFHLGYKAGLEKQGESYTRSDVDDAYLKGISDAKNVLEKQGEQKPIVIISKFRVGDNIKTTNEEPLTITKIDDKGYWSEDLFICGFDNTAKWELVEQKPAWSEEDEKFINEIEESLLAYKLIVMDNDKELANYIEKEINLLKSLRPQNTWKPSEEQMDALRYVTNFDYGGYKSILVSLYEQLKKLK